MRRRWSLILPIYGLTLFMLITGFSINARREGRYPSDSSAFYWGAERLETDPLNKHPRPQTRPAPCEEPGGNCVEWDPVYVWIEPGILQKVLVLSALPSFLIEGLVLSGSAKLGLNQIPIFFISMPIFLFAWFYLLGWLIDRRRNKRMLKSATAS